MLNHAQQLAGDSICPTAPKGKESVLSSVPLHMEAKCRNPQKILIISSTFPPHIFGGAEIAAYNRAKLLVKRGHDVSVVTLNEKDVPASWGDMSPEGFKLYRIKTPRGYTLFERTQRKTDWGKMLWHFQDYFDWRNQKLIGSVLDHVQPDHVAIDNIIGLGFNALSEVARRDLPVAYILHDLNLACFNTGMINKGNNCRQQCFSCRGVATLRQNNLSKIRQLGFVAPSRIHLERAKKFIPAVGSLPSCVIRNVPEEVPVLPERKRADHIRLLFVGRIDPVKGIEFLLRTLEALSDSFKFHLTILGTGPSESRLKDEYGHRNWVTFRGFVPRSEVAAALVESDLYCIPSLVVESYGLVTAQALQLGTPVIGSNAGGTAELVRDGETGMLVPLGDEQAWRDSFSKIFSNPELVFEWHRNAVLHTHEFNEDVIGQAYEKFVAGLSSAEKE